MVVNFRIHGINQGAHKLVRTLMLIIIIKKKDMLTGQSKTIVLFEILRI